MHMHVHTAKLPHPHQHDNHWALRKAWMFQDLAIHSSLQPALAHVSPHRLSPDPLNDPSMAARLVCHSQVLFQYLFRGQTNKQRSTDFHLYKSDPHQQRSSFYQEQVSVLGEWIITTPWRIWNNQPGLKQLIGAPRLWYQVRSSQLVSALRMLGI